MSSLKEVFKIMKVEGEKVGFNVNENKTKFMVSNSKTLQKQPKMKKFRNSIINVWNILLTQGGGGKHWAE